MNSIQKMSDCEIFSLLTDISAFITKAEKSRFLSYRSQKNVLKKARAILNSMGEKEDKLLKKITGVLRNHEEVLIKILDVNRNVDETLCNILLAIRQNEYLQAWYPKKEENTPHVVGRYLVAEKEEDDG